MAHYIYRYVFGSLNNVGAIYAGQHAIHFQFLTSLIDNLLERAFHHRAWDDTLRQWCNNCYKHFRICFN